MKPTTNKSFDLLNNLLAHQSMKHSLPRTSDELTNTIDSLMDNPFLEDLNNLNSYYACQGYYAQLEHHTSKLERLLDDLSPFFKDRQAILAMICTLSDRLPCTSTKKSAEELAGLLEGKKDLQMSLDIFFKIYHEATPLLTNGG